MEFGRGSGLSLVYGIFTVLFVFVAVTSAQITFSRQWVRGKYPGDNSEGGESPEFQRSAKAVLPKRTYSRYIRPAAVHSEYVPILVNPQVLEEILDRIKDPAIVGSPVSVGGISTLETSKK